MMLTFRFCFLGHFWRENGLGHRARPLLYGASKPNQKVGPLGEPFGPTTIFEIFRPVLNSGLLKKALSSSNIFGNLLI